MERLRTFIAIELPATIREELCGLQEQLRSPGLSAKWVFRDNIHLTLKFLGPVESGRLPAINSALEESLADEKTFSFNLEGLGVFPSLSRPRVVWVGIDEGKDELKRIAGKIEDALASIGFPKEERRFSAHITLSRVKREAQPGKLREKIEGLDYSSGPITVSRIVTMKSNLTPEGPIYTRLGEVKLG